MKRMFFKKSLFVFFISSLLFLLSSCVETPSVVRVNSVTLSGDSEVEVGATIRLSAIVLPENATNRTVSWKSSNTDVVTVKDGVVTGIKAGTATITATVDEKSVTKKIVVKDKQSEEQDDKNDGTDESEEEPEIIRVKSVKITGDDELEVDSEITLIVKISPENATNKTVTWKSNRKTVATVENGVVTGKKAGTATITATVDGKSATKEITVKKKATPVENPDDTKDEEDTSSDENTEEDSKNEDTEKNLITSVSSTDFFYAIYDWNDDPSGTLTGSLADGFTATMPKPTDGQWKAQVKFVTDADVVKDKNYKFSIDLLSTVDMSKVTAKLQVNGGDDAANNTYLFAESDIVLLANAKKTVTIEAVSVCNITDALLILDFGGNPAATVKISNIKLSESQIIVDNEVHNTPPAKLPMAGFENYKLVWADEFTQSESNHTPLKSKWGYDIGRGQSFNSDGTNPENWAWGNNEDQWYSNADPDNTYVSDGTLKINAIKENKEGANWTSGRIVTRNIPGAQFKYGYIEMRAKIPYDKGVWPAFWMLDNDIYAYNGKEAQTWPLSGEIDIMETSVNLWQDKVYGTLHCAAGNGGNPIITKPFTQQYKSFRDGGFHTYAVNWEEDHIDWYYDGIKQFTYTPADSSKAHWPYNEEFYIIINLAVGGNLGLEVPATLKKSTMEVDYVRVWQK